ncbi:zinc finger protein 37 homolog isoform X3 [Tribolium castaneum]|uniref:zinc finger protein 37 homolog isoform X3 n=1 Tax=Tribolium castaneum TaxID=7070 RepID=UPI00046BEBE2|nr:PREDICTED: zinc finger protein 37 homolog isoform X3 [Tribolium castaneum]XP_008199804.1 PREDICTED: zinc finger protein 37 homolog isoform X3 [Tribolium castaneum]XP_015837833.1 PREDICTED: zinc finger protein 37 homolog isoform X3 [Tribolium castaneum]XP_015837835.1 PREDICTED: zinc finger protein 37 homolog isoform X3 [Tribolium castaneum]XP_015837836.1 PREDICTED: zinc finger protein 37 homolog isoform X3 [Tribolium castaneum]XP_015837837.1 PREDICTED: zinc finger protein 37 homolog isoform |eukprot:XP_008199803.1 PREDICTED: zinc finger protein 37 homolog isoform X3 [Tribolium castaneum]
MVKCIVNTCGSRSNLHVFPKDKIMFQQWCTALGIKVLYERRKNFFVCSKHFDDSCYFTDNRNRSNLKSDAIPSSVSTAVSTKNADHQEHGTSLELEHSDRSECVPSNIEKGNLSSSEALGEKRPTHAKGAPVFSLDTEVKRVVYSCKFPLCKSAAYRNYCFNKRFFTFPKDEKRQQLWRTICKIEPHVRCDNFRICEDHFEASDFWGCRSPLPFAVPKALRLNDSEEQIKKSDGPSYDGEDPKLQIGHPIISAASPDVPTCASPSIPINQNINQGCPTRNIVVEITKPYFKALKSFSLESNSVHEVCRICFRLLKEEEIVNLYDEGSPSQETKELRDMLEFILPELDLELYTNVVVCTKCRDLLAYSYELQHAWMCTEKKLQKVVEEKKSLTNLSSDLVIVTESSVGDVMREHHQDVINVDHDYEKNVENAPVLKRDEMQDVARRILDNIPEETINPNENPLTKKKVKFFYRGVNLSSYNLMGFRKKKKKERETKWGEGPYICEMCGFCTKSLTAIQRHLRKHATNKLSDFIPKKRKPRIKSFKCDKCDQLFTSQQRLERHFSKHQTYSCGICDKEFKQNSALQTHIKHVHLRDYNYYQCHLCGKQFCYKNSLKLHFLTHNPIKTEKCDLCPKKFVTRIGLAKHLRSVHSDAPPLTCNFCNKSIKTEKNLVKHIQLYHFHEGDICDICDKPFSKKQYLIKHKMRVHGVGTPRN